MIRLSKPFTALQPDYDVIVVGSGYGGSIAASRFSRAGLKVCLLERGKEFQPGDYPDTLAEAEKEMQINADNRQACKNGLYDFHFSDDISVFKGCGLGGTSLVNANVSIQPEDRVFEDEVWPSAIRNDMQSLQQGYEIAKQMLKPVPYPENKDGYPVLAKTQSMRKSAEYMGKTFKLPDINVNFEDQVNHVGVTQKKCNNCGDCVTGCNHSAKNTLIMNYLPDAVNHGAEIFCNIDVEHIAREAGKWVVYFDVFNSDRDKFKAPLMITRATTVIIAGGALGSSEILLRSKLKGLNISDELGKRFTGNGDVLGFAYNCNDVVNGIGLGKMENNGHADPRSPVGPCITGLIDLRNQPRLEDGMTFEEGSIPGPLAGIINTGMLSIAGNLGVDTDGGLKDWLSECKQEVESLFKGPYAGATNRTQTFLVMSHDDGKGELSLKNNRMDIQWPKVGTQGIFTKANDMLYQATKALGGTYMKNFTWNKVLKHKLVTVHPLGGCCMAEDASKGVTDDTGNVFKGKSGNTTFEGLYVMDGSIIPRPLGTNPLLTISALAERACKLILERMDKNINYDFPKVAPKDETIAPGVQFTETMRGFFSTEEKSDFNNGYTLGKTQNSPLMFTLTIQVDHMARFVADPEHRGLMAGTVIAPNLSSQPLTISNGVFNLFVTDEKQPEIKRMIYQMQLNAFDGKQYFFYGYKMVKDDNGFDLWKDTSQLFVTIYDGKDAKSAILGKGYLRIQPLDFATQMTTIKALNTKSIWDSLVAIKTFSQFFSKNIIDTYFAKLF